MREAIGLRACSKSPDDQGKESQVNELQAGVEQSLAVLPQPPVLLQPGKAAFDNPAFGHHLESVKLVSFGNLHCHVPTQDVLYALREGLSCVAAVAQQALHLVQIGLTTLECHQCTLAISNVGSSYRNGMR